MIVIGRSYTVLFLSISPADLQKLLTFFSYIYFLTIQHHCVPTTIHQFVMLSFLELQIGNEHFYGLENVPIYGKWNKMGRESNRH